MPNQGMNAAGPSNDEYETPPDFFKTYDTEFGFDFDAAANVQNHLCDEWTNDILDAEKGGHLKGRIVWCNPPYSMIDLFVTIAMRSSARVWVFLLPSRTGNDWFPKLRAAEMMGRADIRWMRKRIQFLLGGAPPLGKDGKPQSPRFDSMVAIVRPR